VVPRITGNWVTPVTELDLRPAQQVLALGEPCDSLCRERQKSSLQFCAFAGKEKKLEHRRRAFAGKEKKLEHR
jgi:hypothetical protein